DAAGSVRGSPSAVAAGQVADLARRQGAPVEADVVDVAVEVPLGLVEAVAADEEVVPAVVDDAVPVGARAALDPVEVELEAGGAGDAGQVVPVAVEVAGLGDDALGVGGAGDPLGELDLGRAQSQHVLVAAADDLGAAGA